MPNAWDGFEILLLSELYFDPDLHEPLLETLKRILHPGMTAYSIFVDREDFSLGFLLMLDDDGSFEVTEIEPKRTFSMQKDDIIYTHVITRKSQPAPAAPPAASPAVEVAPTEPAAAPAPNTAQPAAASTVATATAAPASSAPPASASGKPQRSKPPKKLPEKNSDDPFAFEEAVVRWIERGGNVDARYEHETRGMTMLMHAAARGLVGAAEALIRGGASLDLNSGSQQFTALMYAVRNGQHKVMPVLLKAGASCTVVDKLGRTALLQVRGPDSMALSDGIYYQCVPPTEAVNLCINLLREHMGLAELAPEDREHRVMVGHGPLGPVEPIYGKGSGSKGAGTGDDAVPRSSKSSVEASGTSAAAPAVS